MIFFLYTLAYIVTTFIIQVTSEQGKRYQDGYDGTNGGDGFETAEG